MYDHMMYRLLSTAEYSDSLSNTIVVVVHIISPADDYSELGYIITAITFTVIISIRHLPDSSLMV